MKTLLTDYIEKDFGFLTWIFVIESFKTSKNDLKNILGAGAYEDQIKLLTCVPTWKGQEK